jgi:hypothetical protein
MEGQTIQWPSERRVNGRTMAIVLSVLPFTLLSDGFCCLSFHLPFFMMAFVLSVLPFTLLSNGHCVVCPSIYPTTQWPSERRVNGRTDNTMAIRKKGKWKDRQNKPPERRVNGMTDNTMAILMACVVCPSIYPSF